MKLAHNLAFVVSVSAFAILGVQSASAAGLLVSLDKLQKAGGSGSFEVLLTNTELPGGTTYDVAGFSFELLAIPGTDLSFTAADYPTSGAPPYIFEGTGQTLLDPSIPLSADLFPNAGFSGSDIEFALLSIPIAPGDVFSLGLVSFTSTSSISLSDIQGTIVAAGTSISDENFDPIPYSLPNAAVPEPSSLVMTCLAGGLILGGLRARRRPGRMIKFESRQK